MAHSAETKAKISAGVGRARAEGKVLGKPFTSGDPRCTVRFKPGHSVRGPCNFKPLASKTLSGIRLSQIEHERQQQDALRAQGYEVFAPTVVCDCIAVKNGKVIFVEFKQPGQPLRAGQQRIHDLVPSNYMIIYAKKKKFEVEA